MSLFTTHTIESAPTEAIRRALIGMKEKYGFVPNLGATLAESPVALKALFTLYEVNEGGTLTSAERQLVYLAASITNGCAYCAAAHSMLGAHSGLDPETVQAMNASRALKDGKLEALRDFASLVVAKRGHVTETEIARFLQAGHTRAQVFEVLALIAAKIITNYANHMTHTAVDEQFWQTSKETAASTSR